MLDRQADRQVSEAAETHPPIALGYAVRLDAATASQQSCKGDPSLHARHVHADADMVAMAESDVPVRLARDIEAGRIGELGRVTVRRADADGDQRAFGKALAVNLHRREQAAVVELDRPVVAQ